MAHPARRRIAVLLLSLIVCATTTAPTMAAHAGNRAFRLIAMDMRQDLSDSVTYETYAAHLAERISTASSTFSSSTPNLIVLPEDAGLMAWIIGPRAVAARGAGNSAAALASLAGPYAPQIAYYSAKCPGIPPARALVLALTDTAWRGFAEPLASLAGQYDAWIMASLNAPDVTVVRDPEKVAVLADPAHVLKGYAYEGDCEVHNRAVLFAPSSTRDADGAADPAKAVYATQRKAYLVPIERAQDVGLAMSGEDVADMRAIDTGFARLGVLTSKDAWMADVAERLDVDGMEVFLQPEAGAWAAHGSGLPDWPPDAMHRAIWGQVQRLPDTRVGAVSNLTGNFFDLYFDGTATITKDAEPDDEDGHLLGRLPTAGYVARADWVVPDPPPGVAGNDVAARRAFLDAAGAKLVPGSGDPLENTQREELVTFDVVLPDHRAGGPRVPRALPASSSVRVAESDAPQWAPWLARMPDGRMTVVFTDLRERNERPAAVTLDGSSPGPVRLGGPSRKPFDQQSNRYDARGVASPDGTVQTVLTGFGNQSWNIYGLRTDPTSGSFGQEQIVDHSPLSHAASAEGFGRENINLDPSIAAGPDGSLFAVWADLRGRRVPWRIAVARSTDGGASWLGDVRADGEGALESTTPELGRVDPFEAGDQFAPAVAVAANGDVWVAWQDHTNVHPKIRASRSTDGGASFSTPIEIDPAAGARQYRPALATSQDGAVAVAWEDERDGTRAIRVSISTGSNSFGESRVVDPSIPSGARQERAQLAYAQGGDLLAVWQDDRAGDWDVVMARASGSTPSPARRVDDGPSGAHARLPAIAVAEQTVAIAWEDTRHGAEQIYIVERTL